MGCGVLSSTYYYSVQMLGLDFKTFGFRVSVFGFRVCFSGICFRFSGIGLGVWGVVQHILVRHHPVLLSGLSFEGVGSRGSVFGFRVSGFRFRVSGFRFRVSGSGLVPRFWGARFGF